FDATPAANAIHTSNRGAGTGIVDQYLDDRGMTGLSVLMGGGRKWFLPASTPGSARGDRTDYAFSSTDAHTADIVKRWGAAPGAMDKDRNLLAEFQGAGFTYAADKTALDSIDAKKTDRLLGLFALSNMNVALDKIDGRRNKASGMGSRVVDDYGFPDQPMLDEMTTKALAVLDRQKNGFVLMIEGASIDKQAHNMDTERWMLDTLEFDRAVALAQAYAAGRNDTLVIVTADHECAGVALIGSSRVSDARLQALVREGGGTALRDAVVGAGHLRTDALLAMDPRGGQPTVDGEATTEPAYGLPAVWVDAGRRAELEARGMAVVDASSALTSHLMEVLR
ncbi:MAG: hypothetical protein EBR71_13585, partial [Planctomycetes bacterium]|nr:hypothetical protein [Planctomycetota bacterium]